MSIALARRSTTSNEGNFRAISIAGSFSEGFAVVRDESGGDTGFIEYYYIKKDGSNLLTENNFRYGFSASAFTKVE